MPEIFRLVPQFYDDDEHADSKHPAFSVFLTDVSTIIVEKIEPYSGEGKTLVISRDTDTLPIWRVLTEELTLRGTTKYVVEQ